MGRQRAINVPSSCALRTLVRNPCVFWPESHFSCAAGPHSQKSAELGDSKLSRPMRSTCHIFCKTSPSTLHRCLSSLALRAAASTSPTATGEAAVWESVMARQRPARLAAQPPGLPKQGQSKLNVLLVFLCWCSRSALGLLRAKLPTSAAKARKCSN